MMFKLRLAASVLIQFCFSESVALCRVEERLEKTIWRQGDKQKTIDINRDMKRCHPEPGRCKRKMDRSGQI